MTRPVNGLESYEDLLHTLKNGRYLTLWDLAAELSHRLIDTFRRGGDGWRPVFGGSDAFALDPHWRDYVAFYEYFHGDNGAGIGASHQTGWTGLVAKRIQQCAEYRGQEKDPLSRRSADERLAELVAR